MTGELRELQRRFFSMVTEGDATLEGGALSEWLDFDAEARARERASIYRDAYRYRLVDSLRDDYPSVAALLGGDFEPIVAAYVARHPPTQSSLRHLGHRFAGFVAEHASAARFPWIGELAALEWARVEAFDTANEPLLTYADLAAIEALDLPAHVFRVASSARVSTFAHPVHRVWRALEDGTRPPSIGRERTDILVWRRELVVCHRVLDGSEASALRRIGSGAPFAEVCEVFATDAGIDSAAAHAAEAIARWIADGVFVR
jgi:hypothetical protein